MFQNLLRHESALERKSERTIPTHEYGEPGAIEVFLAIHKVREILRLVEHETILLLPAREILKRLEGCNVDVLITCVKSTVDA